MSGPAKRRSGCAIGLCVGLPWLALAVLDGAAWAQTMAPDMLRPGRDNFASAPLRGTSDSTADATTRADPDADTAKDKDTAKDSAKDTVAPSRIGHPPVYDVDAASGAADTGFDSLNRARKKPKLLPGQPKPKPSPGPGTPPPAPVSQPAFGPVPPALPPSASANKPKVAPALAGRIDGEPPRRRLPPDDDPFGAVGDVAGGFLIKSAVEVSGGYDSNPGRTSVPKGSPFYVVAPEFLAASDWDRHALVADLRGSFTGYGNTFPPTDGTISPAPTNVDRPDFTGHIDGRLDVSHDFSLTAELRLRAATDNPGSPNIQAGLAKYPIFTTVGGTVGFDQNFNRLNFAAGATIDRTAYQYSQLTDGTSTSNDDRNFTQTGGVGRISYDLLPGVKPFVEIEGDSRVHDLQLDRYGYDRDSSGGSAKAGSSFEFTRLLTGELAAGYALRDYVDPRLNRLQGLLTSASLIWSATPLTTAKFLSTTSLDETTLPGVSGVLTHLYTIEVDHDFRRWLTAVGRFSYGTLDYQGDDRHDKTYSIAGDLIYKATRNLWIKGELRRDWLDSSLAGYSTASTVVMLGVRVQN